MAYNQNPIDSIENKAGIQTSELLKLTMPQYFNPQQVTHNQELSKGQPLLTFDKNSANRVPQGNTKEFIG